MRLNDKIQDKWKKSQVFCHEGVLYADGQVTLIKNSNIDYDSERDIAYQVFEPFVDCRLEDFEKYDDVWWDIDIHKDFFPYQNQIIVFGGKNNCGFVASISDDNLLNWSIFLEDKTPVIKATIISKNNNDLLICDFKNHQDIEINLKTLRMKL